EQPVDPATLERVAKALAVESHTLYMTQEEATAQQEAPAAEPMVTEEAEAGEQTRSWRAVTVIAVIGLVAIAVFFSLFARSPSLPLPKALVKVPSLAIFPSMDATGDALMEKVRDRLEPDFKLVGPRQVPSTENINPDRWAERVHADIVLSVHTETVGRFTGMSVYLHDGGNRVHLWSDSFPQLSSETYLQGFAKDITQTLRHRFLSDQEDTPPRNYPAPLAQRDFLYGMVQLERPILESYVQRASLHFQAALRRSPDYAKARAGLCVTLLKQHKVTADTRWLSNAEVECHKALDLDPDDPMTRASHGLLLRALGRFEEAEGEFVELLQEQPKHIRALIGLAMTYISKYLATGSKPDLDKAIATAERCQSIDPKHWKAPFVLGLIYMQSGDMDSAIKYSLQAKGLDANAAVLSNLGTMQMCRGDLDQAAANYEQAYRLNKDQTMLNNLAALHSNSGRYEQAVKLYEEALARLKLDDTTGHHLLMGNYAEGLQGAGRAQKALEAYLKAAELAEIDLSLGADPLLTRASLIYYYTCIGDIDPSRMTPRLKKALDIHFERFTKDPGSQMANARIAQTWSVRGEKEKARKLLTEITAGCPGYAQMLDLDMEK
ncbi:MAG: tetratricopeptide repeat protein, partial [Pseudomonadota bacterium]